MKPDDALDDALRAAAHDLQAVQPPPEVWAAVNAACGARAPHRRATADTRAPKGLATSHSATPRPRAAWRLPLAWSGAFACGLVLLLASLLMLRAPAGDGGGDFIALQPADRVGDGPAWVVDAEIASDRLAALGLPYDPTRAGDRVRAQLLLHPSGDVLAVRFVR